MASAPVVDPALALLAPMRRSAWELKNNWWPRHAWATDHDGWIRLAIHCHRCAGGCYTALPQDFSALRFHDSWFPPPIKCWKCGKGVDRFGDSGHELRTFVSRLFKQWHKVPRVSGARLGALLTTIGRVNFHLAQNPKDEIRLARVCAKCQYTRLMGTNLFYSQPVGVCRCKAGHSISTAAIVEALVPAMAAWLPWGGEPGRHDQVVFAWRECKRTHLVEPPRGPADRRRDGGYGPWSYPVLIPMRWHIDAEGWISLAIVCERCCLVINSVSRQANLRAFLKDRGTIDCPKCQTAFVSEDVARLAYSMAAGFFAEWPYRPSDELW